MATSLEQFLEAANTNKVRANNQFELEAASGYSDIDNILKKAIMFGQNITLPSRTTEFASIYYKGAEFTNIVPTRLTWDQEHTMTMVADTAGEYRRAFLAWQGKVINPDISGGSVFEGERGINEKSVFRVKLFGSDNKTVVEVIKFFNVKIKQVGGISLQYDGGDTAKFDLSFTSTYWEIEKSTEGGLLGQK